MPHPVQLNNVDYADLKVVPGYASAYGDSVNQALVFPTEYGLITREYVILIQKNDAGAFQSVALLGLDKDENLYLDGNRWNARYVPAMHQRGPFMIGFESREVDGKPQREPMIHVDLDHPRIDAARGIPLFLAHGGNSPYLNRIMEVLQIIHEGAELTQPMFSAFDALGLLENAPIRISLSETEHYMLEDYYSISRDRFAQLDANALYQLHQAGYLGAAFAILSSFQNIQDLVALKIRKQNSG
jgi:hypothetical protein